MDFYIYNNMSLIIYYRGVCVMFKYNTHKVNIFEDCIEYFEKEITQQKDIKRAKN